MTQTRLPLRIARREVRRRPGRTALAAMLVALPVCAMTLSIVIVGTDEGVSRAQSWELEHGQADAVLAHPPSWMEEVEQQELSLPRGARAVEDSTGSAAVRITTTEDRRVQLEVRDLPLDDPITEGIVELRSGRAPRRTRDVALTEDLARRLGVTVGADLAVSDGLNDLALRVVGLFELPGCLRCSTLVVPPQTAEGFLGVNGTERQTLIDLPEGMTAEDLAALTVGDDGWLTVRSDYLRQVRPAWGEPEVAGIVWWSLVLGGMVLLVAGIVISAAFAVGARRQMVTIGQLSANGMEPAVIRSSLVLQGTVTGVLGTAIGLVLAGVLLAVGQSRVEWMIDQRIGDYVVRWSDLVLVAILGVGASSIAALVPAREAARVPVVAALAGRRPLPAVSARQITRGVVAMVGGLALLAFSVIGAQTSARQGELWALLGLVGGAAELLGACALAPVLVSRLEPLSVRLSGAWRLGARSLARQRSRTGTVVAAVAAAGALAVTSGAFVQGASAQGEPKLPPDAVFAATDGDRVGLDGKVSDQVVTILGGAQVITVRLAQPVDSVDRPIRSYAWAVPWPERTAVTPGDSIDVFATIADDALLDALRAEDLVRASLARDGVAVLANWSDPGPVTLQSPFGDSIEAQAYDHRYTLAGIDVVLITERAARDLGLAIGRETSGTLFVADHELTSSERAQLDALAFESRAAGPGVSLAHASPKSGPSPLAVELVLSALALVFAVLVVGTSLALAAAETRDERDVLTIAGAPPPVLARVAGVKAWLIASIGALVAIPVGFLPVVVVARTTNGSPFPVIFPTRTALVLVLLTPLVVALASWAASAASQRLRPVRVSTATFE